MNNVAAKVHCSSGNFAVQLLEEDFRGIFQQVVNSRHLRDHNEEFMELYEIWKKQGQHFTWQKVVSALKSEAIREMRLAKSLQRKLEEDVFV